MSAVRLKETVPPKTDQIKKKYLLLMKYQRVADVVKEIYSCATFVKRVGEGGGGLNGCTIYQYLRNTEQKNRSPENFQFHNF